MLDRTEVYPMSATELNIQNRNTKNDKSNYQLGGMKKMKLKLGMGTSQNTEIMESLRVSKIVKWINARFGEEIVDFIDGNVNHFGLDSFGELFIFAFSISREVSDTFFRLLLLPLLIFFASVFTRFRIRGVTDFEYGFSVSAVYFSAFQCDIFIYY